MFFGFFADTFIRFQYLCASISLPVWFAGCIDPICLFIEIAFMGEPRQSVYLAFVPQQYLFNLQSFSGLCTPDFNYYLSIPTQFVKYIYIFYSALLGSPVGQCYNLAFDPMHDSWRLRFHRILSKMCSTSNEVSNVRACKTSRTLAWKLNYKFTQIYFAKVLWA